MDPYLYSLLVSFTDILYRVLKMKHSPRFIPWPSFFRYLPSIVIYFTSSPDYSPANFPSHFTREIFQLRDFACTSHSKCPALRSSFFHLLGISLQYMDLLWTFPPPQGGFELHDPDPWLQVDGSSLLRIWNYGGHQTILAELGSDTNFEVKLPSSITCEEKKKNPVCEKRCRDVRLTAQPWDDSASLSSNMAPDVLPILDSHSLYPLPLSFEI